MLEAAGINLVKTPFQAPNANAFAQRFVRSIKDECSSRIIPFGEGHLRRVIDEYLALYNHERNRQGIGNELIDGEPVMDTGDIECIERVGGQPKF